MMLITISSLDDELDFPLNKDFKLMLIQLGDAK